MSGRLSRAERRRHKHDPLNWKKNLCVTEGVPEHDRLTAYGWILIENLTLTSELIRGLPFTPGHLREARHKELATEFDETVEALAAVQSRLEEIEELEKTKPFEVQPA